MADAEEKQHELPLIPDIMYYPGVFSVVLELYWICKIVLINKNVTLIVV